MVDVVGSAHINIRRTESLVTVQYENLCTSSRDFPKSYIGR